MTRVILKLKADITPEESWLLANCVSQEVIGKDLEPIPAKHPPPVHVRWLSHGDSRGPTFELNSSEDATVFVEHVLLQAPGVVEKHWLEPWLSPVVNVQGIERLDVHQ